MSLEKFYLAFPVLAKDPSLAVTLFALLIPIVLLASASQFSKSSAGVFIVFGILGLSALVYSAWILY